MTHQGTPSTVDTTLVLSFEPDAIRDHFEGDEPNPVENLDDDQLTAIALYCISSDRLYRVFHELLEAAVGERVWRIGETA